MTHFQAIRGGDKTVKNVNVDAVKCLVARSGAGPGECAKFKQCAKQCSLVSKCENCITFVFESSLIEKLIINMISDRMRAVRPVVV